MQIYKYVACLLIFAESITSHGEQHSYAIVIVAILCTSSVGLDVNQCGESSPPPQKNKMGLIAHF